MDSILTAATIAAPISLGLVQLAKMQGLPTRFAPITSLLFGVIAVALLTVGNVVDLAWGEATLTGVVTGLTAAGVYSGVKATVTG